MHQASRMAPLGCGKRPEPARLAAALLVTFLAGCTPAQFPGNGQLLADAVARADAIAINLLVQQEEVDPDEQFAADGLPLVAAPILAHNLPGLTLLLDNGADPNARRTKQGPQDTATRANAMVLAASEPDLRYLDVLLFRGGDPRTRSPTGESLLRIAYLRNDWLMVQRLVEYGAATRADAEDPAGRDTVAAWYSEAGDFDKVYWLLEHGVEPTRLDRAANETPRAGETLVVTDVYWRPATPAMAGWQARCQLRLQSQGIDRRAMPAQLRRLRMARGLPVDPAAIPIADRSIF